MIMMTGRTPSLANGCRACAKTKRGPRTATYSSTPLRNSIKRFRSTIKSLLLPTAISLELDLCYSRLKVVELGIVAGYSKCEIRRVHSSIEGA
jgi:hypothetical protein